MNLVSHRPGRDLLRCQIPSLYWHVSLPFSRGQKLPLQGSWVHFPYPKQRAFSLSVWQISFSPRALQKMTANQYFGTFVFYYIINTVHRETSKGAEVCELQCKLSVVHWYLQRILTKPCLQARGLRRLQSRQLCARPGGYWV